MIGTEGDPAEPGIDRIAVVGAGRMGHGIAAAFAMAGHPVSVYDADPDVLERARDRIPLVLETLREHGPLTEREAEAAFDRIDYERSLPACVAGADLVTEAVVEDISVKRSVFEALDDHAPTGAILATNTSGLSITKIASVVDDPARVVGTHWFNPPYVVPLVEVVYGEETDDATVSRTRAVLDAIGKTPVTVETEIPGFIGNRIQLAMAYEAFSLLDRGVASAEAIDTAIKAGFGFRLPVLGIFEKVDHSGLDVHHAVESSLLPELDRGTEPNPVVTRLIADGHEGLDDGQGIYDWSDATPEDVYRRRDEALLEVLDVYDDHE